MDLDRKLVEVKRESAVERRERHPELKARRERMLEVVENASGDVRRADEAEPRAIEELRQRGLAIRRDWGQKTSTEATRDLEAQGGVVREVKDTAVDVHVRSSHRGRADRPGQ